MAKVDPHEKLWRYTSLVRTQAWILIAVGLAMILVSLATQAASKSTSVTLEFVGTLLGITGVTGVLFYPLLHMWLRKTAPSGFLPRARRLSGPRRLEAGPADWRSWVLTLGVGFFLASVAMLGFLIGVLRSSGPDGIAEGVVIGVVLAWGLVMMEDARRIEKIESDEGRRYFTAARRPLGAGNKLVWVAGTAPSPPPETSE